MTFEAEPSFLLLTLLGQVQRMWLLAFSYHPARPQGRKMVLSSEVKHDVI